VPVEQNAAIEVSFAFTREDYLHYVDFWLKRRRRPHQRWLLQRFGLALGASLILFLVLNPHAVGLAVVLALFLAVSTTWSLRRRHLRRYKRVREEVLGQRMTRISADGLFGRYSVQEILTYWPAVTEMTEDDDYLFIFTSSNGVNVIPKRAFADAPSLEQFREAAKSFWNASRSQQPPKQP
jgi:hypothetical protein